MRSRGIYIDLAIPEIDIVAEWLWLIPSTVSILAVTKFGDLLFRSDDERIVFLDTLDGSLSDLGCYEKEIINSDHFFESHRDLLSVDRCCVCAERGMKLEAGQCFGWKVHPMLGGKFEFENIGRFSVRVYEAITGQLARQMYAKPQGFRISGLKLS